MKAPKCKTCGAEEWRHKCGPSAESRASSGREVAVSAVLEGNDQPPLNSQKEAMPSGPELVKQPPIASSATQKPKARKKHNGKPPKRDRAAYMTPYMQDYRAAKKLGLTMAEYRTRKEHPNEKPN